MTSASIDRRLGLSGNTAVKTPVTVVSTSNITLSGEQTIDGVAVKSVNAAGAPDRVLCTGQTTTSQNGIWDVNTGSWTRSRDANGNYDLVNGSQVVVAQGTAAKQVWILTTADPITIGTTGQTWSQNLSSGFLATLAASSGSSLVGFIQAGTGAQIRTSQAKMRDIVSVLDFIPAGTVTSTTDCTAYIQAAEDACAASGFALYFPAGTYKCSSGLTKKSVNWYGDGKYKSILDYYGNSVFITAVGSSPSRIICTIQDMEINGTNGGAAAKGITLGWNMRSTPFLRNVHIYNFGHYGMHFTDQNWNISFDEVEVDTCGRSTVNSAGIFKDAAVDGGTFNYVSFNKCIVEACGLASSTAGGINMPTTTANRGLYFNDLICEGNKGADEIYITNMSDLQFTNLAMERDDVAGWNIALEMNGCNGSIRGGYITGTNAVNNLVGIKAQNCVMHIEGLKTATFGTAGVQNFTSIVYTGRNSVTFGNGDANAQWFGDYSPRVSAHKNGSNQTVGSGAPAKVTFGTAVYDLTSAFTGSTLTPIGIGAYQVDCCVTWATALDNDPLILFVYVNGAAYRQVKTPAGGAGEQSVTISTQVQTTATTDTIEVYAQQSSGGNKDIDGTAAKTWLMISQVGRTS